MRQILLIHVSIKTPTKNVSLNRELENKLETLQAQILHASKGFQLLPRLADHCTCLVPSNKKLISQRLILEFKRVKEFF